MLRVQWKVKNTEQAGQLFVDNFGRLNMTVQTEFEAAVAGTWNKQQPLNIGFGGAALLMHQMNYSKLSLNIYIQIVRYMMVLVGLGHRTLLLFMDLLKIIVV